MRWENCHEYFLSKDFRESNPDLSELLDSLSLSIRTSDRNKQREVAMKLIAIVNKTQLPKMVNQFIGSYEEVENYLNNLNWSPVCMFLERDGESVKIITIR